ncbi:hypothetical protein HF086_005392 [Spodoptera exigua]|uniref:PX domain-containing protein n=1 Tax=Spodoptera exigua TaxID=7107 RepID=A0A922M1V6_SPOEX|nr:hypothetical protein HF086_005392 [Spodoptera exigua]
MMDTRRLKVFNLFANIQYNMKPPLFPFQKDCVEETSHDPLSAPAAQTPGSIDPKLEKKKPNENVSLADNSLLIPPAPPRPDFDASREKLQRLGEGEGALTREEFLKMKEDEYLATFKKTVAMHEVFLQRLAAHPVFRNDSHLRVFLEYEQDLCAKPRGKMDLIGGLVSISIYLYEGEVCGHEIYLGATVRDVNDFFEQETTFLQEYYSHLKEAVAKVDRMTTKHKGKLNFVFEDLRCLAAYEAANRNLEKARAKNKDVHAFFFFKRWPPTSQYVPNLPQMFDLTYFYVKRSPWKYRSLLDLAELEIKHARSQQELFRKSLQVLKECQ